MPPLAAALVSWLTISTAMAYVIIATVVLSAGMAVYGSAQARRAERNARDAANAAMKDRMVTRIATEAPHRYIYGRAKVGADIVAMFTSGSKDQFKHLVCVHAAHECDAIEAVYVNNALVDSLDASGDPTAGRFAVNPDSDIVEEAATGPTFTLSQTPRNGSVWVFSGTGADMQQVAVTAVSGKTVTTTYTGPVTVSYEIAIRRKISDIINEAIAPSATNPVVRIQKHLGGASDVADAYLRSVVPGKWPDTAVLRGLCYTVITLDLNHAEFQGGLVPIHAIIRGRKLYDPRTGLAAWSQNPALAIRDYLTSPLCAVPATDLPTAQFIAAANVCDENIAGLGARYTINGTVTSEQGQASVLESMTQAMAGSLVSTTWDIYAGKYIAPVAALTQEDIVGGLSVTPGVSDASVYNGVKGQYISPENKHVQTDFKPYQNSVYRASDGRDLYTNIDFAFTDSLQRVTNLARIFTEDQRNGFTIKAEFSLKAWPRKVGERVTFTSPVLGQTAKVYRITDKSYSPNSAVQLTLKEDAASIWDFADAVVVDSTPNSDLPDPWKVDAIASIACTSGEATLLKQADGSTVPRILVSWPALARTIGMQVEVEWRAVSSPTWDRVTVSASETKAYLSPITPGFFYIVRARVYNPYLNIRSYEIMTAYQVQIVTARPTVYMWASTMPSAPVGSASWAWATSTFGAAPSGWSLTEPAAPAGVGNMVLWAAAALVSNISASGSTPFNWPSATVSAAAYDAAALIAAKAAADAANTAVSIIAADNWLSKGEKPHEVLKWNAIVGEFNGIQVQADNLLVGHTTFDSAYVALFDYLNSINTAPAWTDLAVDTPINGTTYRTNFLNYYNAKMSLLNAIAAKAATMALWPNIAVQPNAPANNATSDIAFLHQWMEISGNSVAKSASQVVGWNAQVYSPNGFYGGAYASAVAADTTSILMFGLDNDPLENSNYDKIAYAFYMEAGNLYTFENGVQAGPLHGTYVAGDVLTITYDGTAVRYIKNSTILRTVVVAITYAIYFDSSFNSAGAKLKGIRFGPMTSNAWSAGGGAGKPQDNATVGAPAGSNVGNTLAEIVESRANGAVPTPTFTLTGTFGGAVSNASTAMQTLSKALSAVVAGNTNPVTITWEGTSIDSNVPFMLSNTTGGSTTISATATNQIVTIGIKCTATDDVAGVARIKTGTVQFKMGAV